MVAALGDCSTFALDLETSGLAPIDSRILLCQIGVPGMNYVIDATRTDLSPILPFTASPAWRKIIQNSKFERRFFLNKYGIEIPNVFDTMLAEMVILPGGFKNSLEDLSLKYLNVHLDKTVRKSFYQQRRAVFTQAQIDYAGMDVEVLFGIMDAQTAQLEKHGMAHIAEMEFRLAQAVADMEETGVPIDVEKWKAKIRQYQIDHEASRLKMLDIIYSSGEIEEQMGLFERGGINVSSPKQLLAAFNKIGIDISNTDEREIALIDHPAAKELLNYRGLDKILTAYGSSFLDKIHPFTGRLHADFQQLGTETGRFSCKEPNLQQMPKEFRQCVTGAPEWVVVGADYSQIELRILAELSGDPNFIRAFTSGVDLHKSTASMMFGIPMESVTPEQRFTAKTINFGISYGMGPGKLMDTLNAEAYKNGTAKHTFPEIIDMLDRYKRVYAQANRWLSDASNRAFINLESVTMYGRKRFYTRPDQNSLSEKDYSNQVGGLKRKGANSPIQGTNADITKLAMLSVYENLREAGFNAKMIIQVHDEIVVLAQHRQAEQVKDLVVSSMVEAGQRILKRVPVIAEAYVSPIWNK